MESSLSKVDRDDVEIKLSHGPAPESRAFTELDVDIIVQGEKAGHIDAVLIDRARITRGYFLSEMDDYSQDTQWLSDVLFEPKAGRTRLKSLVHFDDPNGPFMYIKTLTVDFERQKHGNSYSDIGAFALNKLMNHLFLEMRNVTLAIYVADGCEQLSKEEMDEFRRISHVWSPTEEQKVEREAWYKRVRKLSRKDAIQFLRNGFFQDEAYANGNHAQSKILVAAGHHWRKPMISQSAAEKIPVFDPPEFSTPQGKGAELLKFIKTNVFNDDHEESLKKESCRAQEIDPLRKIKNTVSNLISEGATVVESGALHAAIANNDSKMVKLMLEFDHDAIDAFDHHGNTPLMTAAIINAGRTTINGIPNTCVLDFLLEQGADKKKQDSAGMTAYGKYLKEWRENKLSISAMMGKPVPSSTTLPDHPSEKILLRKLLPDSGPTEADLNGGGADSGFIDYDSEDDDDSYDSSHDEDFDAW